jgi:hypothetical protein
MADRDAQYDPYIPAGGAAPAGGQGAPGNQRTAALQAVSDLFIVQWCEDVFRMRRRLEQDDSVLRPMPKSTKRHRHDNPNGADGQNWREKTDLEPEGAAITMGTL